MVQKFLSKIYIFELETQAWFCWKKNVKVILNNIAVIVYRHSFSWEEKANPEGNLEKENYEKKSFWNCVITQVGHFSENEENPVENSMSDTVGCLKPKESFFFEERPS